jgi:carboxymethylenebutenolidase
MPNHVTLTAEDRHQLDAYVAGPKNAAECAVVIVQEIFGVNSHIRSVADDYAREGFLAVAPALFDRVERGVELGYEQDGRQRGMAIVKQIGIETALKDVAAGFEYARTSAGNSAVGVVGFCWGGSLAWLAATRLNPAGAVGYYGGQIVQYVDEQPHCPVMLHFGAKDPHIGPDKIEQIRRAHPEVPLFLYDAGHGFNCDQRKDYDPGSAKVARQRTLEFLKQKLSAKK